MAVSCIFLCCRGDRVLFLPREREVEVSSFGSLLKRKDMAKRGARSETERGRRGGLYPEAVAGARMQTGRENVDNSQFSRTRRVASHPVMTASRQRQHAEADVAPPESGRGPLGGRKKIRDSPFKLFGRRSEAGVLVAEQLLIVRVRLRDRPSALMEWPDWLERAVAVPKVPLSPCSCLGEPAHDSTQPADQRRNNPSGPGGQGPHRRPSSRIWGAHPVAPPCTQSRRGH